MSRAYGVYHRIGLTALNIAHPAVFLIEPDARISYSFIGDSQREYPSQADLVAVL